MAWWMWVLVVWATVASAAAFWLAALVAEMRSQEWAEHSARPLELPWVSGTAASPLYHFDPQAIVGSLRARIRGADSVTR